MGGLKLSFEIRNTKFKKMSKSQNLKSYIFTEKEISKNFREFLDFAIWPLDDNFQNVNFLKVKLSNLKSLSEI